MVESIIQWNIRGLSRQYDELQRLLRDHDPFGICLQETKLRPGNSCPLKGYKCFSREVQPALNGRAHGGVAVFVKEAFTSRQINLRTNLQAVAVRILLPVEVTLISLYLPDIYWSRSDLEDLLSQLPSPVLICGDFNSHNTWWGSACTDPRGRILEEIIDNSNLILLNSGSMTHFNTASKNFSAIDLSLASPAIAVRISEWTPLGELYHSDHYPIILKTFISKTVYQTSIKYNLSKADWPSYSTKFVVPSFVGDVNVDVERFTVAIRNAAEYSVPKAGGHILKHTPVPWWTPKCSAANIQKKRAFNRYKRYPTEENLLNFKQCRARERHIFKQAKRDSFADFVSTMNTSTSSKEVWKKVRSVSSGYCPPSVPTLKIGEEIFTEPGDVAECMAEYFEQVSSCQFYSAEFIRLKGEVEQQPLDFETTIAELYNSQLTLDELEWALAKGKDTAPGSDGIPYELIQKLPNLAKRHLLQIFNNIWNSGMYPYGWQEALIVPILKEGKDPSSPSNYRPISLTNCLSKVLEAIVNQRLVYVLETQGLYSCHQAGFRRFHSTMDQLCFLEAYIQDAFISKEHVLAVFFDLEKAYDTTWRYGILRRCHQWGLKGNLPKFIRSFLLSRRFRVRIGSTLSNSHTQENGIPQGSVLSVTLFTVAVNSIADRVREPILKSLYVDDLGIFLSGKDIIEMGASLQTAIDEVAAEAERSGFKFSQSKTVCVHFCRMRKEHNLPVLRLNDFVIEYQNSVRFLGLIFDKKLNWQEHIDRTAAQARKSLNIIKVLSNFNWGAEREILKRIFIMITCSKLEYGAPIYSSARRSRLRKLDKIYNEGLRIVTGAFRTSPIHSLYVEADVLPPQLRRMQMSLMFAAGVWGRPNHFVFSRIFESQLSMKYNMYKSRTRPLGIRVKEFMEMEGVELEPLLELGFASTPPWTLRKACIRLDLAEGKKDEIPPFEFRIKFLHLLDKFKDFQPVFTDGSKGPSGVGCAVYTEGVIREWTLPPCASVYTAELLAIRQALVMCLNLENTNFLICTDNLSSLIALQNKFSKDSLVIKVYEILNDLCIHRKKVVFVWVPGHVGITGNEEADIAARRAAASSYTNEIIPIQLTDMKNRLKRQIWMMWQKEWDESQNKLKTIKPHVRGGYIEKLSRREQVILSRLRIGHTRVTHLHLLLGKTPPKCPLCNETVSVTHILEECQGLRPYLERAGLTNDLRATLAMGSAVLLKLFAFLKSVNLYYIL